jgi:hypothetical protein
MMRLIYSIHHRDSSRLTALRMEFVLNVVRANGQSPLHTKLITRSSLDFHYRSLRMTHTICHCEPRRGETISSTKRLLRRPDGLLAMIDLGRLLALTIGQVTNIIFGVGG